VASEPVSCTAAEIHRGTSAVSVRATEHEDSRPVFGQAIDPARPIHNVARDAQVGAGGMRSMSPP